MIKPRLIDEKRLLIIPGDHEQTITFALEHFIQTAIGAIEEKEAFFVALSGGSTPKEIYQKLASQDYRDRIDWNFVHLFWSDERSVPPTSSESNYHMALEAGLKTLPIPQDHIHRMAAEETIEANAKLYEALIQETLQDSPFDLIMLGMGEDGHTASLFPGTQGLKETKRLVIPNHVPQQNTWRMTFTYPLINAAKQTAIYVLGDKKKERLASVLEPKAEDPPFPIQRIGTKKHPALWIVDKEASALLK